MSKLSLYNVIEAAASRARISEALGSRGQQGSAGRVLVAKVHTGYMLMFNR